MSRSILSVVRSSFHFYTFRLPSTCVRNYSTSLISRSPSVTLERNKDSMNELFNYTSGRYLFNEHLRMQERYVVFDVDALKRAAESVFNGQHGRVADITKLAEGGFNRVFTLRMQDGFELVAKIPYKIAVPSRFATASEVATLAFLRLKEIAVPEVYGYSATSENPVGAEYILMQKACGIQLTERWRSLNTIQIKRVAHSVMEIEKKLFQIPFSATGSIYFKSDISPELQAPLYDRDNAGGEESDRFCIGPISDYMFWYGRRADLRLDRGPWKNPIDYLRSTADKEIAWTKSFGKDREPDFPFSTTGVGKQSTASYIALLENYKQLAPCLLPEDQADQMAWPTLRHPDLTPGNIFVSLDTDRVSCLIDWQHAVLQPRRLASYYPRAFENPEAEMPTELIEPSAPKDVESLPAEARSDIEDTYRRQAMFYYYRVFNGHFNQAHITALRDPFLQLRQHLVDRAGRQWNGNLMTLKGALIRTTQSWDRLPDVKSGTDCPVSFEKADVDDFMAKEEKWLEMSFALENWRQQVCFMNEDGWVRNEDFEEAEGKLKELTDLVWSLCKGDAEDEACFRAGWPFRDHEEVD